MLKPSVVCFLFFMCAGVSATPTMDKESSEVAALRDESNAAIAAHDPSRLRKFFDDNYYGIEGSSGTIDSGGDRTVQSYADEEFKDPTFVTYRRIPTSIVTAQSKTRVAESGRWEGLWRNSEGFKVVSGVYLAMWSPYQGSWRLKSESFVTLSCTVSISCDPVKSD